MSTFNRENALTKLEEIQKKYQEKKLILGDANEAETRLIIIDEILTILGYSKDEFSPEYAVKNVGFIDYLVKIDNVPRFIVEAKRIGKSFIQPSKRLQKNQYSLGYMRTAFGPSLTDVIEQAENYSKEMNIPFAVITNGAEWVLIQTYASGKKNNELICFYFGNLLLDSSRFDLFWELLSKPSVLNGNLEENFSHVNISLAEFVKSPDSKLPNIQWNTDLGLNHKYLRDFYDYFFDEIVDPGRKMMLKKCFITSSKLDQYSKDLKRTLQDSAPAYISNAADISPDYNEVDFLNPSTGDQKGKVILIIGSVGCGKSTFINKILLESKQEKSNNISLVLDLINEFDATSESVSSYLWSLIDKQWKEQEPNSCKYDTLKKIFGRELKLLKDGPYAQIFKNDPGLLELKQAEKLEDLSSVSENFLSASWKYYVQTYKRGIILFLDNIDRTSDNYQRFVYTFAHKVASRTGATVILTMRESTYFRGKKFGVLDVRSDDVVYHLQTPDRVKILSKRIEYIEKLEEYDDNESKDYRLSKWRQKSDWAEFRKSSLEFSQTIKATFLESNYSSKALELLNAASWHNLRTFLTHLRDLHIALGNESKGWPISYIISALATASVDGEDKAVLPNLYFPIFREYPCYFLKIRIILLLLYGKQQSELRKGISLNETLVFTKLYGYQERWSRLAIQQMVRERLLECMEIPTEKEFTKDYVLSDEHTFRVAPLSVTMIDKIYCNKIYLLSIGREIPFQSERLFTQYISLTQEFFETIKDTPFNKDGISLFLETQAYSVVARFLVEAKEKETSLHPNQFPEISNVEDKLEIMMQSLCETAGIITPASFKKSESRQTDDLMSSKQIKLFDISSYESIQSSKSITEVPEELNYLNKNSLRLPPKIFWALIELKARGKEWVTGSEIAHIINQYLVDDLNQVEPTNISKALRGRELSSLTWLKKEKLRDRKTLYSITENWKDYWLIFFPDSPFPSIF